MCVFICIHVECLGGRSETGLITHHPYSLCHLAVIAVLFLGHQSTIFRRASIAGWVEIEIRKIIIFLHQRDIPAMVRAIYYYHDARVLVAYAVYPDNIERWKSIADKSTARKSEKRNAYSWCTADADWKIYTRTVRLCFAGRRGTFLKFKWPVLKIFHFYWLCILIYQEEYLIWFCFHG